jgi:hypothetical protein
VKQGLESSHFAGAAASLPTQLGLLPPSLGEACFALCEHGWHTPKAAYFINTMAAWQDPRNPRCR